MADQPTLFDPKLDPDLSRGRDNPHSQAAHRKLLPHKATLRERCFTEIDRAGWRGRTLKELARDLDKPLHSLSGRLTELRKAKLIYDSGDVRDDCGVWRATREAV